MRKKILYIVEAMGGGVFSYIVDLSNELIKKYDLYIAYAVRPQTPLNYREYFDERIQLIQVANFERSINPLKDIRAFWEIKRIAKEVQPNIIHLHSSKAGALGRFAFNGRKVPLFYTPHGYSFLMENHSIIKRVVYRAIEVVCGKRYCTTISCSKGEHEESKKLTKHAKYVSNGINISELQDLVNLEKFEQDCVFTIYTVGRICYQKNPMLFNQIAEAIPNVNFLWIGDGELRDELRASNIKITGWVERKEALKYASQADVFILTSLWEGLPISLLEAMFMRKLCIVSNVVGNKDVVCTGENGIICNSLDDYINAIHRVRQGNNTSMIDAAYQDIVREYNTIVMADKYIEIYEG